MANVRTAHKVLFGAALVLVACAAGAYFVVMPHYARSDLAEPTSSNLTGPATSGAATVPTSTTQITKLSTTSTLPATITTSAAPTTTTTIITTTINTTPTATTAAASQPTKVEPETSSEATHSTETSGEPRAQPSSISGPVPATEPQAATTSAGSSSISDQSSNGIGPELFSTITTTSSSSSSPPPPQPTTTTSTSTATSTTTTTTTTTTTAEPVLHVTTPLPAEASETPEAPRAADMGASNSPGGAMAEYGDANELESSAWRQFLLTYNKTYQTEPERAHRRSVFVANLRFIVGHNERSGASYKLAVNQFADMTNEEINNIFVGPAHSWPSTLSQVQLPPAMRILSDDSSLQQQQSQVDWRNLTGPPVNQGTCLESSVFAALAAIESALSQQHQSALASEPQHPGGLFQPGMVQLSASQVLDCMASAMAQGGPRPCAGLSSMVNTLELISHMPNGLASAQAYAAWQAAQAASVAPQSATPQAAVAQCGAPMGGATEARLATYSLINEPNIPEALANAGPLIVALDGRQSTFHFYRSGVYHDLECSSDTYNTHALLTGLSPTGPAGEPDQSHYIVRMAFGPSWGESGFVRLLRDDQRNKCVPRHLAIMATLAP